MHTITVYNENEIKELNDIQNIQGEDKVWIDLVDPTDDVLQTFVGQFHLNQSAIELFKTKVLEIGKHLAVF
jgi:Mg2+ and Co2+ transporter CorA